MLQELADESENKGLKINKSKTKMMLENNTLIHINNTQIKNVESYKLAAAQTKMERSLLNITYRD